VVQVVMSGNHASSYAAKLARVQVIAAYPITPQTTIVEKLATFVASGELPAQYIKVESEHSALQACIGAAALGARTFTATSSQGLLLMHELLHWASGARAPIVMGVVNRAVAPPWSLGTDHTDTMSQRDTGWIQFYAESNQEVLDTTLIAYRLAEDPDVRLPVMVAEDAFYLSQTVEPVDIPSQDDVDRFLPPLARAFAVRPGETQRYGSFVGPELYMEFRYQVAKAMKRAAHVRPQVEEEYRRITGRHHGGSLAAYRVDDADAVLITMGTASTTARSVVDTLRARGKKIGLAKLRLFRPFPVDKVCELAATVGRIGVMDRCYTYGAAGPAYAEVVAALFGGLHRPIVRNFIAGLGGRDVTPEAIEEMYESLLKDRGPEVEWVGLKRRKGVTTHG